VASVLSVSTMPVKLVTQLVLAVLHVPAQIEINVSLISVMKVSARTATQIQTSTDVSETLAPLTNNAILKIVKMESAKTCCRTLLHLRIMILMETIPSLSSILMDGISGSSHLSSY
jgi:hypothetical protein